MSQDALGTEPVVALLDEIDGRLGVLSWCAAAMQHAEQQQSLHTVSVDVVLVNMALLSLRD